MGPFSRRVGIVRGRFLFSKSERVAEVFSSYKDDGAIICD